MKKNKVGLIVFSIILIASLSGGWYYWWVERYRMNIPLSQDEDLDNAPVVSFVLKNLDIPWSLVFLPNGNMIYTERAGKVYYYDPIIKQTPRMILDLSDVHHDGEGGLLGLEKDPYFDRNSFIYLYYTFSDNNMVQNRIIRYSFNTSYLVDPKILLNWIPGAWNHDGGRVKFGPDGYLYITTGDAANSDLSQDLTSLAGKILRIYPNGSIPESNPFPNSPIFSWGHRNPQGLTWDGHHRLWATEHGSSATDELNLIEKGKNYGWPEIRGDESQSGMMTPVLHSGLYTTWAPSGMTYSSGDLYWTGLRGQSLYRIKNIDDYEITSGITLNFQQFLSNQFGRLRDVIVGPDGFLYVLTNNRDGRGIPTENDDYILRISPKKL